MEWEWWKTNVLNNIINEAQIRISTRYCPIQGGYFWDYGELSSGEAYPDPYDAIEAFIIFQLRTKIVSANDLDF